MAIQQQEKGKDNTTVSRCQRESRELESSMDYNGKGKNVGGRVRGNLLLKLKLR